MYIAVIVIAVTPDLSLDDVVAAVERLLQDAGVDDRKPDRRVSPVPDARTVRYYTTLGLVDRPRIVDREARYGQRHVLQLAAIKRMQADGARLADVQRSLYGRSDAELQALLATAAAPRRESRAQPVEWREVEVMPGLRLLAQADWTFQGTEDDVMARVRAALDLLSTRRQEKGRQ
jgi:DNA-binding transcriptional MerR regulator